MSLQASVILLTGGGGGCVCLSACWNAHTPGADAPQTRHPLGPDTPWDQTPPGADTPSPRAETPWDQTPPPQKQTPAYGQRAAGRHPTGMHSCLLHVTV